MSNTSSPGATVASSRKPGPPWNADRRVTMIEAPSERSSHTSGGSHSVWRRPLNETASSRRISSSQPSPSIGSASSSRDTRSPLRALGGDTSAANVPSGGLPQQMCSSQISPESQSAVDLHSGGSSGLTSRHAAGSTASTAHSAGRTAAGRHRARAALTAAAPRS